MIHRAELEAVEAAVIEAFARLTEQDRPVRIQPDGQRCQCHDWRHGNQDQRRQQLVFNGFAADPGLSARFPDSPAAKGLPTASLKTFVTDRPGHDRRYAIDETKARAELGYAPARTFDQGFAETLGWYLANEGWWRAVIDGSYRDWVATNYRR
jgi:hypothetical protein